MKNLLEYTEKLKHLPRTGWLRHNISPVESVAAHSWQMAMMAMKLSASEKGYDFEKVIKLCLCHDIGESMIGDITPSDTQYKNKSDIEQKAIKDIARTSQMPELERLFAEYEKGETPEAQLANDLDKLDMYAQSLDYEKKFKEKDLEEFRQSARKAIKTEVGKRLLKEFEA